ncbi:MAG: efflux RND transporter periplasmic adaptor subunit [Candidatus Zixiibacteriota bacterium]
MKRRPWLVAVLLTLTIVCVGIGFMWTRGDTNTTDEKPRYKAFPLRRGTLISVVSADGVVKPIYRVEIKSKASGRVEELPVEAGKIVVRGQLFCRLDQTDVKADLDQAQADLEIAQAEIKQAQNTEERRRQLLEMNLISQEEYDQVALTLAQAKGKLVRAQTSLERSKIRFAETLVAAPIDGVVLQKYVEIGQIIASGISNVGGGTKIADIADMRQVYVEAGIDEIDVGKIGVGQVATIVADAYPSNTFTGTIVRVAPEARVLQNVTLFDVVIKVENIDGLLKSGMNVNAEVTVARSEDAVLIPMLALLELDNADSGVSSREVLVKEGDTFAPRAVELGLMNAQEAVVLSGLTDRDTVGVPMVSRLKEENDRMQQEIRSSRGFGSSNSSQSRGGGGH